MTLTMTKDRFSRVHCLSGEFGGISESIIQFEESPVEQWKTRYEEWKHHIAKFRQAENKHVYQCEELKAMLIHRYALCRLIGLGGVLALDLLSDDNISDSEKSEYCQKMDMHIENLRATLEVWHSDPISKESEDFLNRAFS